VKSYAAAIVNVKDRRSLTCPPPSHSLRRVLKTTGENNGRHTTGAGARRRSAYEHQLDDHRALLRAFDTQGVVLGVSRNARVKTSDGARLAARAAAAVLPSESIEPHALMHDAQAQPRPGVAALRWEIALRLAWTRENDPAVAGWARPQSVGRMARDPRATGFLLPRRSWTRFTSWRQVVREIARLALRLHRLLSRAIPLRRDFAPTAQPEGRSHGVAGESRPGATYRDHGRAPVEAAWFLARPFPAM
jgi:hypothetical protein